MLDPLYINIRIVSQQTIKNYTYLDTNGFHILPIEINYSLKVKRNIHKVNQYS